MVDSAVSPQQESSLLIPVPEAEPLVQPWRQSYDPVAARGVPAHLTLIYPFLPPTRLDRAVEADLQSLFVNVAPIRWALARAAQFPGVLYLAPEPAEPFVALIQALSQRYPEAPPYGGAFATIIPHVTVAQHDDPRLLDQIAATLAEQLPIRVRSREVWLQEQGADLYWRTRSRFALGQG